MTNKNLPRIFIALFIVSLAAALFAAAWLYRYWHEPRSIDHQVFEIRSGSSASALLHQLKQIDVIDNVRLAKLGLRVFASDSVIKHGEYDLPSSASLAELIALFASGSTKQYSVTLVEGQAVDEFLRVLANNPNLRNDNEAIDSLSQLKALLSEQAQQLMGDEQSAEGWFFPDTYHFSRGDTVASILLRAHKRMMTVLNQEWLQRENDLPYESPYQALIMASLIEKETGAVVEREQIAGVFVRRLQRRMRLQTDPTVIYGLGDRYQGNLTRAHLKADHRYNTYTRHGLPPTPIAAPGQAAIYAALHPADGSALYFVAKGDGSHYFSETLEEHRQAVKKYQVLQRRSEYRSAPLAQ